VFFVATKLGELPGPWGVLVSIALDVALLVVAVKGVQRAINPPCWRTSLLAVVPRLARAPRDVPGAGGGEGDPPGTAER
jgi:hypothetical protein